LANLGKTIEAVKNDPKSANDYKKLLLATEKDTEEYKNHFNNYYAKGMVDGAAADLDRAWVELDLA
jgi:hypothetical protein